MIEPTIITFRRLSREDEEYGPYEYLVISINGVEDPDSYFSLKEEEEKEEEHAGWSGTVRHPDLVTHLLTLPLTALSKHFRALGLRLPFAHHEYLSFVNLEWRNYKGEPSLQTRVGLNTESLYKWAKPWSVSDLHQSIRKKLEEVPIPGLIYIEPDITDNDRYYDGAFETALRADSTIARDYFDEWYPAVSNLLDEVMAELDAAKRPDALVTVFQFPEEISTPCQQYLLYFGQFLRDLGVDANTEVKQEARRVLFTVTPTEGIEALDRVREALAAYFRLPLEPEVLTVADEQRDIAMSQLEANVLHLRGQLVLAMATLQAKDATVEALSFSNAQLRQLVVTDRETIALPMPRSGEDDSEPLISDVVSVRKFRWKGLEFDLPTILRRLKRRTR